jgi:hypothetical protein
VTGAGGGFSSRSDISKDFQYAARYRGHRLESLLKMRENMHQLITFLQRFDKPAIAAVNGPVGLSEIQGARARAEDVVVLGSLHGPPSHGLSSITQTPSR